MYTPRKTELMAAISKLETFTRYNHRDTPSLGRAWELCVELQYELDTNLDGTPQVRVVPSNGELAVG